MRIHIAASRSIVLLLLWLGLGACTTNGGIEPSPQVDGAPANADAAVLDASATADTVGGLRDSAENVGHRDLAPAPDASNVSSVDMAAAVRECSDICRTNSGWSPAAVCQDYGAGSANAYFCDFVPLPDDTCETKCSRAVNASFSAACRSAWTPYVDCIAKASSYGDTVSGSDLSCESAVVSLMSNCWVLPQLQSAQQMWMQRRPMNYEYALVAEKPGSDSTVWTIKVTGSHVVQAPATPPAPSIDQILNEMMATIQGGTETLSIEVDGSSGVLKEVVFVKPRSKPFMPSLEVGKVYRISSFKAR